MTVEYNTNELRYVSNTQKNKSIFWFKHTEKEAPNEREREMARNMTLAIQNSANDWVFDSIHNADSELNT